MMKNNKVANNAKWIIICKIAQSLLQLVIGMLSARYLGPANYGLINYAKSIVAFVVPFAQLGLNQTLVRELIDSPDKEGEILGTSLLMGFGSSVLCILMVSGFVSVVNRGEPMTLIVCILYSLSMVFQSIELIQYWFHSKLQSRIPSIMMLISYTVVSLYKIFLLVSMKSIQWFAIVYSIEYGIIGFALLGIYGKQGQQRLCASFPMAKRLFARSRHFILASLMLTVFQNTDHVMLKTMSGDVENGIYSAAITCAGVCQFVYVAIIDSMRPVILANKKSGHDEYENNIAKLYCIITYLSLMQSIGFAIFAKPIVWILYGEDYMGTIPVLRTLVWYVSFSFMGAIRNVWILAEGKQELLWKINLVGALSNVIMNAILIPIWGALGAAVASLLTQFFTNFVLGFITKSLKDNNRLMMRGIHPGFLLKYVKTINLRDIISQRR